ncbi:hypothetical protein LVD15_21545 [Fulvivirga maritima]|uniref:hypothetical protein n=1 Tax=Fulvivirga maritima TaxID=2904247 RepID=UPI001F18DD5E|nr:hypothetical protein [Fulvivirga maritima]UII25858.1 hypothetical protein LVD15_21545 [Fulvivirga maritima]
MIAFYGFGGGFGHLTRISRFIQSQQINEPYLVLTSNTAATQLFPRENIKWPPSDLLFTKSQIKQWISSIIEKENITDFYIDTFPSGLFGELTQDLFNDINLNLLCRRLKWNVYEKLIQEPLHYSTCFVFEELEKEHQKYLLAHSGNMKKSKPSLELNNRNILYNRKLCNKYWLVVHSSNQEEVQVLIDHAKDMAMLEGATPEILVVTDQPIEDETTTLLQHENPADYYHHAERIFTAAGFNTWYELAPYRSKHTAIPFPRKFDDQFWRSRQ